MSAFVAAKVGDSIAFDDVKHATLRHGVIIHALKDGRFIARTNHSFEEFTVEQMGPSWFLVSEKDAEK